MPHSMQYRYQTGFFRSLYRPCYHEIDAHGNPIGVIGNHVLGLDLPLPEDALEDAGYDV